MKNIWGITLLELMIAVAVVGILTAVAYPSYTNYVVQARRHEAMQVLYEAANLQEQYYIDQGEYAEQVGLLYGQAETVLSVDTDNGYYQLVVGTYSSFLDGDGSDAFTLSAQAQNEQSSDTDCVALTINEIGARSAINLEDGDTSDECWN